MLGFVQTMLAPRTNPIGVDFGTDCLRLAQVRRIENDFTLVAAASAEIPPDIRSDPQRRLAFFAPTVRQLLSQAPFCGRHAVLSMPAAVMHIQHLRLPTMNDEYLKKAIPWELRGKFPIDPSQTLMRHIVAGEIHDQQETKIEVIAMAALRDYITALLSAAAQAKLDVIGMNTEPMALVDCFARVHIRESDMNMTRCFVDIGSCGTRATIARNGKILFARNIRIGGDHLTRATAEALGIGFHEAKTLRIKLAAIQTPAQCPVPPESEPPTERRMSREVLCDGATAVLEQPREEIAGDVLADQAGQVENACRQTVNQLVGELDSCRQYHEAAFASLPVEQLVFIGGEARQRGVCQIVAEQLHLPAQLGDPLCRMARTSEVGVESGIDRRTPQPAWSVAIGLSMGPIEN